MTDLGDSLGLPPSEGSGFAVPPVQTEAHNGPPFNADTRTTNESNEAPFVEARAVSSAPISPEAAPEPASEPQTADQGELFERFGRTAPQTPTARTRRKPSLPPALADWRTAYVARFNRDPLPASGNRRAWGIILGQAANVAALVPDADVRREAMRLALENEWFAVERAGDLAFFFGTLKRWLPKAERNVENRRRSERNDEAAAEADRQRREADERNAHEVAMSAEQREAKSRAFFARILRRPLSGAVA
jgi:hypothetical protein